MQCYTLLLVTFLSGALACTSDKKQPEGEVLNIPVTFVDGFGPFGTDFGGVVAETSADDTGESQWPKTFLSLKGIPESWKDVSRSMVWLNHYQLVYQNYHQGNIDSSFYFEVQKNWKWVPDEMRLSKKPIRCYVYVIWGTDPSGKLSVMIDTNNNRDFGDENAFYPETAGPADYLRIYQRAHTVEYDIFREGRVTISHIPMVIKYMPHKPKKYQIVYSFARYAKAGITLDDPRKTLVLNPGFSAPSGNEISELAVVDLDKKGETIDLRNGIRIGEFIDLEIDGEKKRFQNLGFDEYHGMLRLKGAPLTHAYSTQVGYKLKPFTGKEFTDGSAISMGDFKGKYLFIDFWATWCKPCVEQMPELASLYGKVDTDRVAFLGIVGEDRPDRLKKFLQKKPTAWPQIFSDTTNRLVEVYNIQGYPFSFLIGPDGRIVDKNLNVKKLEAKLNALGCLK